MTNRLFIALEIPGHALDQIIGIRDSLYGEDNVVRWEGKEKLHVTLKFLGDVELSIIPAIESELAVILEKMRSFKCNFNKYGIFYKDKEPKILWAGLKTVDSLKNIYESIEFTMEKLGFHREKRRFKPHITLLRIRGKENFSKLMKFPEFNIPELNFNAEIISIIKSELLRSGSVYSKIKSFKMVP